MNLSAFEKQENPVEHRCALIPPVVTIEPTQALTAEIGELRRYRNLLFFLCWRDLKVRYKQTTLGAAWAVAQPLFNMLVFTLIFGQIAKIPSDGIPYPLFSFAALIPWTYFSSALTRASLSIVNNGHLIGKIYFPRVIIPLAAVLPGGIDFAISTIILIALLFFYGYSPTIIFLVGLPFLFAWLSLLAFGMGLWLSAIHLRFRDIGHALPLLTQLWMYLTPVIFPMNFIPERFRWLIELNPMTGAIETFRSLLFGLPWNASSFSISLAQTALFVGTGLIFFHKKALTFADAV